jgi:hypothetical protein
MTKALLFAGAVALAALTCLPAQADIITITATVDGGPPSSTSSGLGTLTVSNVALGPFSLNTVTVTSQVLLPAPGILDTNTLNLQQTATGSHTLILDIIASALTGPGSLQNLLSSFSVSGLTDGWTAREQTFINGTQLADTGIFTTPSGSAFSIDPAFLSNPFSAEVIYTIVSNGIGGFNGGTDISVAAVPGPVAGAGFPGILAGLVALWGLNKRRRRNLAA